MRRLNLREVVIDRTGIVLNAEGYTDGRWVAGVRLSQDSELSIGQRELVAGQIAVREVVRSPISVSGCSDSPPAKEISQSDHDVRFSIFVKGSRTKWRKREDGGFSVQP